MRASLWRERATLTRLVRDGADVFREVVLEGSLSEIAAFIERRPRAFWEDLLVSLPDRGAPPVDFAPHQFDELIRQLHGIGTDDDRF